MERTQYARARLLSSVITDVGWLYLVVGAGGLVLIAGRLRNHRLIGLRPTSFSA